LRPAIQVFYNKSGAVKYARARHYKGQSKGKPQFEYHQQSLGYLQRKFSTLSIGNEEIGHIGHSSNVDLEKTELSPKVSSMAGGEGFEPSTPNLGGWCSIRTELLAQISRKQLSKFIGCYNSNVEMITTFKH
jgi:hypothetical protein